MENGRSTDRMDTLAVEEPLEMRVTQTQDGLPVSHNIAVTMRTPGNDFELAAGFLYTERIVTTSSQILNIAHCGVGEADQENVVKVSLTPDTPFDPKLMSRNVYTTSACGICGKASIDLVRIACPKPPPTSIQISEGYLKKILGGLEEAQELFSRTGGLHAAGLFDGKGELIHLREDVGRHNAVDKIVGALLLADKIPAGDMVILVSGRASYELIQKSLMAGIPILAAVGAPSSLAVDTAKECGMTLIGFLRDGRFNVYAGGERLRQAE